jgi:hypothetical protein
MTTNQFSSSIDNLIDQIDQNHDLNVCAKCLCASDNLFILTCNHFVCLECIEKSIDDNNYKNCPSCNSILTKNLHKIYSGFLADPVAKLAYYHDIRIGNIVWCYGGNDHNWLYSKDHSNQLNDAYKLYEMDEDKDNILELQIGQNMPTYIIDFNEMVQYQKMAPNKRRPVSFFKFRSLSDLKKNKIIGVSGKLL